MNEFLEWLAAEGYVLNKEDKWYKVSKYPRVYLKNEELVREYEQSRDLVLKNNNI